ncbi:MAG: alpha-galactosidase [Acidobacteriaceae bacterium]
MNPALPLKSLYRKFPACKSLALAAAFLMLGAAPARSQSPSAAIHYNPQTRVFRIDGGDVSYVFGVNAKGQLQSIYWGQRVAATDNFPAAHANPPWASFEPSTDTTPQEYTGFGGGFYYVPDLKITFPNGNRDLVLKYVSHSIHGDTLDVVMKDISLAVYVTLEYQIDPATGILRRSATVENKTPQPFTIEQDFAATWNLPANTHYELRYLTGRWAGEWNLQKETLHPGKVVLGSRTGTTSHHVNPWFAIERGNPGDQDTGAVWFGALGWSGNWQIAIEQDQIGQVRVTGGFNPFDFAYILKPGQSLRSPYFYAGFSHHGIGGASRLMHRFELTRILPEGPHPKLRPVLYDSWEATGFNVDVAGQEKLAEEAASIGVERFVMDDGWFGERNTDHAGLGDWWPNPKKFPNGLKPLIDKVHSLGMSFGIWVEPEMVNPDSQLYRKHPDWVLNFPGRPRSEARNQLVLNLARPDVKAYVFHVLDHLLSTNDISFVKWDYNRNWAEPGWPAVPADQEKEVYVKYIRNLYAIFRELRARHPNVEFEDCSGGGGRVDLGIMRYTDEVWPSDNTDPFDRLSIQQGFTYAYTPGVMMAWVTGSPNWVNNRVTSLQYRFLSSMEGSLGIGANLNKWTPEDFATARKMVAQYKTIRATVQQGALYRLISPLHGSEYAVNEYVNQDGKQTVAFAYLHSSQKGWPFPHIYLRGLDPSATYTFHMLDGKAYPNTPASASGAYWMHAGVQLYLRGDFQAALLELDRQ